MSNHKLLCSLFDVEHESCIPRPRLVLTIEKVFNDLYKTRFELYCLNPKHELFKDLAPQEREAMDKARKERRGKIWQRLFKR